MPRLAVIETPALNAFASGLKRTEGSVTVTRGLMETLDPRELNAVLAHELTHIRNGDARLGVIAAIFAGIISLVAEMVLRGTGRVRWRSSSSSSDRRDSGSNAALFLIGLALVATAWGLAVVLRMALSRNREFLADAGAVELTQDPDAMIGALRKIEGHSDMPDVPPEVRAMFLDDHAGSLGNALMATHPPIEARIAALVRYAGGHDPGPRPTPAAVEEAPPPERPWDDSGAGTAAPGSPGETPWWKGPARGPAGDGGSPWAPR
jgi:heat shock protein HtpX